MAPREPDIRHPTGALRARRAGSHGAAGMPLARAAVWVGVALIVVACGSSRTFPDKARPADTNETTSPATAADSKAGSQKTASVEGAAAASAGVAASPSAPVDKRALADFERAVGLMRSGKTNEAELEFKQLIVGYPQLVGAYINLAILERKANRLDEAEAALKSAVEKNPSSALAWSELGLTQRMRGQFQDAAASYEKALAANPDFAPAHRNYGVLLDLYLGDPERALTELERYKEITGEDKPVTGWIAELRQRTGKPPAPKPGAAPAAAPAEAAPADSDSSGAPPASTEQPAKPAAETSQPRIGANDFRRNERHSLSAARRSAASSVRLPSDPVTPGIGA